MKTKVVLTVISKDRPGLVEKIAAAIASQGGNWESSRMSRLGGQFAGIVQATIDKERKQELLTGLEQLEAEGIRSIIHTDDTDCAEQRSIPLKVKIIGQDHPGIVRDITLVIHKYDANVEELHTELDSEPMSGDVIFAANIRLMLYNREDLEALRTDLENVAGDLMVDIEMVA
jgi:glycine cleavage system regulatory protein